MVKLAFKIWAGLSIVSLVLGLTISSAVAQNSSPDDGIKLSISPLPILLSAQPGQVITHELEVRNSGSKTEILEPQLLTFSANNENGEPQLKNPEPGDDYLNWISFSPNQLSLEPLEWGKATMTINIPQDAAYGYYFAVTWGRAQSSQQPAATTLIGSVAQLVLLEVPVPGSERKLVVDTFKTDKSFFEFLPVKFTTVLRNSGNIHVAPFGNIFVSDGQGNEVGTLRVNPEKGNILPSSIRTFTSTWDEGFPRYEEKVADDEVVLDENGNAVTELVWDIDHAEWWRFGKYTASLVMAYNQGGQDVPLIAETNFWIIPWRLILLLLAIPVIPAALVYIFMKQYAKRLHSRAIG